MSSVLDSHHVVLPAREGEYVYAFGCVATCMDILKLRKQSKVAAEYVLF